MCKHTILLKSPRSDHSPGLHPSLPPRLLHLPNHRRSLHCVLHHPLLFHQCRKVIVSNPTPLYRHISFEPPLPTSKTAITSHTTLGYYAKTLFIYSLLVAHPPPLWCLQLRHRPRRLHAAYVLGKRWPVLADMLHCR